MDCSNIVGWIEDNSFNGSINMSRYSNSGIYKWSKQINDYLKTWKYDWRVKPNYKKKIIEIIR